MIFSYWRNLRLKNQIQFVQILIVAIIFIISISLSFHLLQIFTDFMKHHLLKQLVLKSRVTAIKNAVIRVDRIGLIIYNYFLDHRQNYRKLYEFQIGNQLQMHYQEEDCILFHFCNALMDNSDTYNDQILSYLLLQNQFIPFVEGEEIKCNEIVFHQNKDIDNLDQYILNALNFMKKNQLQNFLSQLPNRTEEQILMSLQTIDEKKIIMGSLINQSDTAYYKLTQSDQYFKQRSMNVLESGLIMSDTQKFNAFGKWFNNTNFTGFNHKQFQYIKNFANKNGIFANECPINLSQMLCLIDSNNKQQLVLSRYINQVGTNPYFVIIIVDAMFLHRIEDEFNVKLKQLTYNVLIRIGLGQFLTYVICIFIQMIIIQKLNKPLEQLEGAAKLCVNNCQITLERLASIHSELNETQKLTKAFYNLVNRTHHHKIKPSDQEFEHLKSYQGVCPQQDVAYIITIIRRKIQRINSF